MGRRDRRQLWSHSFLMLGLQTVGKEHHEPQKTPFRQRPFKCSYCPYSASQKGNLKTHVLCVHRMPFDNTQYPDRRFKRSRYESDIQEKNPEDGVFSNPATTADGSHGCNSTAFTGEETPQNQD
ncbi:zinc finger protein 536 isoform X5 [Xyrichtys novacula]|uniref:Zinc finger protein 536 isoform X5 n=1 Tax=Xyrichtys novacula TaxID=13765 RepID=A0AAV1EIL3_XYRNO|nr:zinc finger protein 536 isoform X5 [Xyrichtys novacula]